MHNQLGRIIASIYLAVMFSCFAPCLAMAKTKFVTKDEAMLVNLAKKVLAINSEREDRTWFDSQVRLLFPIGKDCSQAISQILKDVGLRKLESKEMFRVSRDLRAFSLVFEKIELLGDRWSIARLSIFLYVDEQNIVRDVRVGSSSGS